ncbi:hypothetical protein P8452_09834 [Trifolium repens]|nr:hypothetical protein P8452_09834 [Trifolium repens]
MPPRDSRNTYRPPRWFRRHGPGTLAELTRRGTRHYMTHNFKNENLSHPALRLDLMLDILAHRKKLTIDEESMKLVKLKDETQKEIDRLKEKEAKIAELKYKKDKIEKKIEKKNAQLIEKQRKVRNMKAAVVRRQKALDLQELKADVRKFKVAEIRTMKPKIRKHESELRTLRAELRTLRAELGKLQAQVPKLHAQVPKLMDVIQKLEDKVQQQADVLRDYEREFDGYKITFEERFKEFEDQKRKEAESSNAAAGEKVYNHELSDDEEVQFLPAYRNISMSDQSRILLFSKAGCSVSLIIRVVELEKGVDAGNLPFLEKDIRNFIQSQSGICIECDASNVLKLYEKISSFTWAIENFFNFVKGKYPQTILTDQDLAMKPSF